MRCRRRVLSGAQAQPDARRWCSVARAGVARTRRRPLLATSASSTGSADRRERPAGSAAGQVRHRRCVRVGRKGRRGAAGAAEAGVPAPRRPSPARGPRDGRPCGRVSKFGCLKVLSARGNPRAARKTAGIHEWHLKRPGPTHGTTFSRGPGEGTAGTPGRVSTVAMAARVPSVPSLGPFDGRVPSPRLR